MQQARFFGYIGERAVAVIAIQNVLAPVGDEEILEAVIVIVADGDRRRPAGTKQPRFFGDIRECAVAIVFVEPVGGIGGVAPSSVVPLSTSRSSQPSLS